ncbi:MAG TPA: hypothetical protein VN222_03655 [Novosphingobium sp.]|nr:hypothetical protein [Novosphingobium sp.]
MTAQAIGNLAASITAGLLSSTAPKAVGRHTGQPVWRNSYTEGQLEGRLWRPIGFGKARGTLRGAKRLAGMMLKAAKALETRTRKARKVKHPGERSGSRWARLLSRC